MSYSAGWYADPVVPGIQRYFDGTSWTAHTRPVPSSPNISVGFQTSGVFGRPRRRKWPWIVIGAFVVVVLISTIATVTSPVGSQLAAAVVRGWPFSLFQTDEQKVEALIREIGEATGQTPFEGMTDAEKSAKIQEGIAMIERTCNMSDDFVMFGLLSAGVVGDLSDENAQIMQDAIFDMRDILCDDDQ